MSTTRRDPSRAIDKHDPPLAYPGGDSPYKGPPGIDGEPGEDGPPGPPGVPGAAGVAGSAGAAGRQGPPGNDGDPSDDWPMLIPGPQGPQGIQGVPGVGGGGASTFIMLPAFEDQFNDDVLDILGAVGVMGRGTVGTHPKWIGGSALGDSLLSESGTDLSAAANLLFTADNTKDIGAVGATRPRTGYFGTSVLVGLTTGSSVLLNPFAGAGLAPIVQFTTGGTTRALFGAAAAANDAIAGTAIGDMFLRVQTARLIFSLDGGTTNHAEFTAAGQLILNAAAPAIRFANSVVNAAVAVTLGSTGPTGSTAGAPRGWVPVSIAGTTRYMPFW